jgi:hypothetical protein
MSRLRFIDQGQDGREYDHIRCDHKPDPDGEQLGQARDAEVVGQRQRRESGGRSQRAEEDRARGAGPEEVLLAELARPVPMDQVDPAVSRVQSATTSRGRDLEVSTRAAAIPPKRLSKPSLMSWRYPIAETPAAPALISAFSQQAFE